GAVVVALALEHSAVVRFRLYESGRMVDEYLSVPTYQGPISKGDELALEANPTLVARLTGADRDTVRQVMRTPASPADLPPPAGGGGVRGRRPPGGARAMSGRLDGRDQGAQGPALPAPERK